MIRVIVVDDHHLVRQGILALMERIPDIEVAGEAQDGQAALELIKRKPPDVVVADVAMPIMDGIQLTRHVRKLGVNTRVVILSMYSDETLVRQALKYGASGYLLKSSVTEELILAVRAAARGNVYLSPEVSRALVDDYMSQDSDADTPQDILTPREGQVLQLVAEGQSNSKIAKLLGLSAKTVEKHRASLMSKLGVSDLPSLIRIAIKNKLIFIDQ
jgi:DNA-binding NarL/FixJ family response regulator